MRFVQGVTGVVDEGTYCMLWGYAGMTTLGSDLNADVEIALFGEGRESKVHAITVILHGTWVGMRIWITEK